MENKSLSKLLSNILNTTHVGEIKMYAGATAPKGWKLCDGSAVSRTDFAALFKVIGTSYGAGDGSKTFNLPDLRGRVCIGASSAYALGGKGGSETSTTGDHTLTVNEIPYHTHDIYYDYWTVGSTGGTSRQCLNINAGSSSYAKTTSAQNGSYGKAHNHGVVSTIQPYSVVNYIIYVGGVLRNLGIFNAFGRFTLLRKGGGVDVHEPVIYTQSAAEHRPCYRAGHGLLGMVLQEVFKREAGCRESQKCRYIHDKHCGDLTDKGGWDDQLSTAGHGGQRFDRSLAHGNDFEQCGIHRADIQSELENSEGHNGKFDISGKCNGLRKDYRGTLEIASERGCAA